MAETTARQLLISALILSSLIAGAFAMIGLAMPEDEDRFSGDGGFNSTLNKFSTIQKQANATVNPVRAGEPKSGILGIINGLIESSWGTLKLLWRSADTVTTMLVDVGASIGLPAWFTGLLTTILIVTLAFALMAAWFKWHV